MRRKKENRDFESLGEIIKRMAPGFDTSRSPELGFSEELLEQWEELVGEPFSSHCRPVKFRKGTLTVVVDSPVLQNELNRYCAGELLETLNERWPWILRIRFRSGKV
jgi:hypothetical protein